jgi:hypothetical protein
MQPNVSIAAVALHYRLNAKLLRSWVAAQEERDAAEAARKELNVSSPEFVPLQMQNGVAGAMHIEIEVRDGDHGALAAVGRERLRNLAAGVVALMRIDARRVLANSRFDRIQLGDPLQRVRSEPRFALCLGDFEEASAAMDPTPNLDDVAGFVEGAMATVRVRLQIAFVLLQVPQRMRARARFGELEHDRRRVIDPDAVLLAWSGAEIAP